MKHPALDQSERRELLRIARVTLREYLQTGRYPPGSPHRPSLLVHRLVAARLWRDGELLAHHENAAPTVLFEAAQHALIGAVRGASTIVSATLIDLDLELIVDGNEAFRESKF